MMAPEQHFRLLSPAASRVWPTPKLISTGVKHRQTQLSWHDSGYKQYQSTIDRPHGMPHAHRMESPKRGSGKEPLLLSVVVDDDESVRESLPDLLREFGFAARAFSSAEEFLAAECIEQTRCLLLDLTMPGMSGPDLQQELKRRRQEIPIVFITAQRDETVRSRLLERGAVECLFKPFSETELLEALNAALRVG